MTFKRKFQKNLLFNLTKSQSWANDNTQVRGNQTDRMFTQESNQWQKRNQNQLLNYLNIKKISPRRKVAIFSLLFGKDLRVIKINKLKLNKCNSLNSNNKYKSPLKDQKLAKRKNLLLRDFIRWKDPGKILIKVEIAR